MSGPKTVTAKALESGKSARASSASPAGSEPADGPTVRAYCRCNSGHFFQGEFCPFDGWSSTASRELQAAVERLAAEGQPLSRAALLQAGVSREAIERTIIVEFGCAASAFEALDPRSYVIDGEAKPVVKLGHNFK
jgi:hypothetical protein